MGIADIIAGIIIIAATSGLIYRSITKKGCGGCSGGGCCSGGK